MVATAMKHMALNFAKLDKFEGVDFRIWQKKMQFCLFSMSVVYVPTTLIPEDDENATMEQIKKRNKWENDDYVCREAKYMVEDASRKKFLVSNFTIYKMTDLRPVMEQYNELLGILGRFTQHKMNIDEAIQNSDKLEGNNVVGPLVVNMVKHNNSSRYTDNRGKCKHQDIKDDPNKKSKVTCWKCGKPRHLKKDYKDGKIGNKANGSGTNGLVDGSTNSLKGQNMFNKSPQVYYVTYVSEAYFVQDDDVAWWVDSGATMHVCKDRCWFKTYESLNDGSILHMGNESTALVHGRGCVDLRFSSRKIVSLLGHVHFKRMQDMSKDGLIPAFDMDIEKFPRPSLRIPNRTEDIDGLVVPEEVIEEVVQQHEPKLRKGKRNKTPKNFGPEFQLYLTEGTRNEVSDQHSYCFNVEDDPKTFDEEMKSHDVAF
ncbi:hypothetical protein Tco_0858032 [Tanacetum coccineum]|uniref:Retrovirus-related Pol polyprotein from transposon TNT 1-94-like beta-barrel domain-containing protein n=1 Tax=Tanacetum coccineum TaxID=301880 RepID=A0ABQ5B866_9ASTR